MLASRRSAIVAATALALAGLASTGCRRPPLLARVAVAPNAISPNHDGVADVAQVRYAIGEAAHVTVTLDAADGTHHALRDRVLRQPRDDYALYFGGTLDGRMLPDGDYVLRIVAEPVGGGPSMEASEPLAIRDGDASPPELIGFAVQPTRFSPNQDGIDDRVRVTYRLAEPAEVRVWLEREDGTLVGDILADNAFADHPGDVGAHVFEYDAGVDADAPPPPDGHYTIVGEARDPAGNVALARVPLAIVDGGLAKAALVGDIAWSATLLPLGDTLTFTATVRNTGDTPIRTRGPEPGTIYDNARSFNAVAPAEWLLVVRDGEHGATRRIPFGEGASVAIDLAKTGADDPEPLRVARDDERADRAARTEPSTEPSQPTSICGTVTRGVTPATSAAVWLFEADGDNGRRAAVGTDGGFCFAGVMPTPAYQRSFARSSGAVRLGLEYEDKATDLEYPYRWQLGRTEELAVCEADGTAYLCLAPYQEVTVFGGVRFVEPPLRRVTAIYAALMHEDVRRMHGPYGRQALEIDFEADDTP